jgi:hypothetical protein
MRCFPRFAVQKYLLRRPQENRNLLRPISFLITLCLLSIWAVQPLKAQDTKAKDQTPAAKPTPQPPPAKPGPSAVPTGPQVAESVIFVYGNAGGRNVLDQIRRNGIERGKITRTTAEGRSEEASYERRFIRGSDATKDKIRVDQKMPTMEYSLVYGDGRLWGIINGANFTPRQDAAASFLSQQWHSIDALLRYQENGSTVTYVDKIKQKGLELFVVDLTDKEKRVTRYYVSTKSLHILWLEYQEPPEPGSAPVKYTKRFHDYRLVQGTWLPYRSVLLADDRQLQETHVSSVIFGVKLEDTIFQNPDAQANSNP